MKINTLQEAEHYLYNSLPVFHRQGPAAYKADIGNISALMAHVGNPHSDGKKFIHIAGTNGKGSTAHLLAAYLQTNGYKTGVYTSPHYIDIRERIKIDGQLIPEQDFVNCLNAFMEIIEEVKPSFFEIICAMAFLHFKNEEVDFAIIETGMGGRLDSTNIIDPLLSVITNISFDHQQFLGDTLEKIAVEKAGIIKPGVPCIIGEILSETKPVFITKAEKENAPICFSQEMWNVEYENYDGNNTNFKVRKIKEVNEFMLKTALHGRYQQHNLCLFLATTQVLNKMNVVTFDLDKIKTSVADVAKLTYFIGRWQTVSQNPRIILESAHNIAGIREAVEQIQSMQYENLYIIFGTVADKDVSPIMPLLPKYANYIWTKANIPRAMNEDVLKEKAKLSGVDGLAIPDIKSAIAYALNLTQENDLILIMGSIFVAGEAMEILARNN